MSVCVCAKSLQSCPTLCDPIDGSPSCSAVLGILQARTLEWVAISLSNAWKWKVKGKVKSLSRVRLFPTPWTAAHQAPATMGFSRQEYGSGVPLEMSAIKGAGKCGFLFWVAVCACILSLLQSCPTLCDPMDCNLPGSSVHGILQARILEWVAISFSRGSSQPRDRTCISCIAGRFFTIWATREAPEWQYS